MGRFRFTAKKIAEALFTNGVGERATQLVLIRKTESDTIEHDLGGWCEEAAIDQIEDVLNVVLAVANVKEIK